MTDKIKNLTAVTYLSNLDLFFHRQMNITYRRNMTIECLFRAEMRYSVVTLYLIPQHDFSNRIFNCLVTSQVFEEGSLLLNRCCNLIQ